jgi:hypothetical protein
MAKNATSKPIYLKGSWRVKFLRLPKRARHEKRQEGKNPGERFEAPESPGVGEYVSSPFIAYGNLDAGATSAAVKLNLTSGGPDIIGMPTTVQGASWAYQFDVLPDQYTLTDHETGPSYDATYTVDFYVTP